MVYPATRTLEAINAMIERDQGALYRDWLGKVVPHLEDAFNPKEETFRTHLGASIIGRECARELWYSYHWTTQPKHEGRMLRLFNRGHLEEGRFIAMLLMIGCQVYQQDENGKQFRISHAKGHFGGSGDGIIVGVPDLPEGVQCLGEFKTHNDKSFQKVKLEGVRYAKFEHFVQMQVYMAKFGLTVALYLAVNKNDDELYGELVSFEPEIANQFLDRGEKIIWLTEIPPKLNNASAGYYKCRFCDHKKVCHLGDKPAFNCRTCTFSRPLEDGSGEWVCSELGLILNKEEQLLPTGCSWYSMSDNYK